MRRAEEGIRAPGQKPFHHPDREHDADQRLPPRKLLVSGHRWSVVVMARRL
jgi:hypothetical protein